MVPICIVNTFWYPLDVDDRVKPIYEINTVGDIRNKYTGKIMKPCLLYTSPSPRDS